MESGCSNVGTNKRKKGNTTGTRRSWKQHEEQALMEVLKELVAGGGWKSENGFRSGYLQRLEDMLGEKLGKTGLCGHPHINSRITQWKRQHAAIQTALAESGSGFNTVTKVLDVSDVAWDKAVKRDPSISTMRYKPWPFYYDWLEIFGNDGANGSASQTINDAADEVVEEDANVDGSATQHVDAHNTPAEAVDEDCDMDVESQAHNAETVPPFVPNPPSKRSTPSASTNNRELLDGLAVLFKTSDDRLDQLVHKLVVHPMPPPPQPQQAEPQPESEAQGHPTILSRSQVFSALECIGDFSLDELLNASDKISKDMQRLEVFSGLPDHARSRYVRHLLDGDFD